MANKKINELYIYYALYNDESLKIKYFSEEDFNNLDDDLLSEIIKVYNTLMTFFSDTYIKKIAISPFFQNNLQIADDNPYIFYGKAVAFLTFYQVELFRYGQIFKYILSQDTKPPEHMLDKPDEVLFWSV